MPVNASAPKSCSRKADPTGVIDDVPEAAKPADPHGESTSDRPDAPALSWAPASRPRAAAPHVPSRSRAHARTRVMRGDSPNLTCVLTRRNPCVHQGCEATSDNACQSSEASNDRAASCPVRPSSAMRSRSPPSCIRESSTRLARQPSPTVARRGSGPAGARQRRWEQDFRLTADRTREGRDRPGCPPSPQGTVRYKHKDGTIVHGDSSGRRFSTRMVRSRGRCCFVSAVDEATDGRPSSGTPFPLGDARRLEPAGGLLRGRSAPVFGTTPTSSGTAPASRRQPKLQRRPHRRTDRNNAGEAGDRAERLLPRRT